MAEDGKIIIDLKTLYKKTFVIRATGRPGSTREVTLAMEVLEREARTRGLTVEDFLDKYEVAEYFGESLPGVYLDFQEKANKAAKESTS